MRIKEQETRLTLQEHDDDDDDDDGDDDDDDDDDDDENLLLRFFSIVSRNLLVELRYKLYILRFVLVCG